MPYIDPAVIPSFPGTNLLLPSTRPSLLHSLRFAETIAQFSSQAFCLLSLEPGRILHISPTYSAYSNLRMLKGRPTPLADWFECTCEGETAEPDLKKLMDKLHALETITPGSDAHILFEYCWQNESEEMVWLEKRITLLGLQQSLPRRLYLCTVSKLNSYRQGPFNQLRLIHQNQIVYCKVFDRPISYHPKLKNLSCMEMKVIKMIYENRDTRSIAEALHVSTETIKTHRSHILKKTGFATTNALVAILQIGRSET